MLATVIRNGDIGEEERKVWIPDPVEVPIAEPAVQPATVPELVPA